MTNNITREVLKLENILSVCGGCPHGDELPQVESQNQIISMFSNPDHDHNHDYDSI